MLKGIRREQGGGGVMSKIVLTPRPSRKSFIYYCSPPGIFNLDFGKISPPNAGKKQISPLAPSL